MRDPFSWSVSFGRLFGITIRVHVLFFIFVLAMWLRVATSAHSPPGSGLAILLLLMFTFVSVLLHELGHCYAARLMDGDAREVLMWPLGGLAACDIPNTPRAHFVTAAGGPIVNLLLCFGCGLVLVSCSFWPSLDPTFDQAWRTEIVKFSGEHYGSEFTALLQLDKYLVLVAQLFWVNWFLFLLNVLLIGFPLDGGRMFQAILWPRLGYRQSMYYAIVAGYIVMMIVGIWGLVQNEVLILCLALFIYAACKHQWIVLETGGEDMLFGYDFSQGYTSLEKDQKVEPRRRRPGLFQRWLQRRAARKLQREQEQQAAEEQRMDELLQKIQREGKGALSKEEIRFLERVSDKYRHRQ
jgi:Zn-dependent protease